MSLHGVRRELTTNEAAYPSIVVAVRRLLRVVADATAAPLHQRIVRGGHPGRYGSMAFEQDVFAPVMTQERSLVGEALAAARVRLWPPDGAPERSWEVTGGEVVPVGGRGDDRAPWDAEMRLALTRVGDGAHGGLTVRVNVKHPRSPDSCDNLFGAAAFLWVATGTLAGVGSVEQRLRQLTREDLASTEFSDYFVLAFEKRADGDGAQLPWQPGGADVWVSSVLSSRDEWQGLQVLRFNPAQTFPHLQMAFGTASRAADATDLAAELSTQQQRREWLLSWTLRQTEEHHRRLAQSVAEARERVGDVTGGA